MFTLISFLRRLSVGLSGYYLVVHRIQRYRVTINPLHVRLSSPPTLRDIVATICAVWIFAAIFALSSALSKNLCEGFLL
jgi:hypothetical protein